MTFWDFANENMLYISGVTVMLLIILAGWVDKK